MASFASPKTKDAADAARSIHTITDDTWARRIPKASLPPRSSSSFGTLLLEPPSGFAFFEPRLGVHAEALKDLRRLQRVPSLRRHVTSVFP